MVKLTENLLREHGIYPPINIELHTENMLDDVYGDIEVCGYSYGAGHVLKRVDSVAFREAVKDYIDAEISENNLLEVDGSYYFTHEVQHLLDEPEEEPADE